MAHKIKSGNDAHELTREERAKGGRKSHEAQRRNKQLRQLAQMILEEEITDKATGHVMTQGEAALRVQARKAILDGDTKALEFLRDTAGQRPVQGVDINGTIATDQAKFAELLEQLRGNRD